MGERTRHTSLSTLLATLDDGLQAKEWEQELSEAFRSGLIDELTASALRGLRARLEEASRREGLLRLLYDTSTDLIAIRDVEAILKAIVRRTRSLLGSDIAYLSLNDYERNESYVRVTDGVTTAAFRNIRMPLGGGVLGAVATGTAPAQSRDYPNDTTKTHFPDSDAAVVGEGVKAIMGVPLWAEGRVIGALMVADRGAHEFTSDDIALMESIGAHAAVALENARLFTDMAGTLDQLNEAQRQNLQHVQTLESLTSLDQRLMETLAADDIMSSLHRLVASTLDADVWILDPSGEPLHPEDAPQDARFPTARDAAELSRERRAPTRFSVDRRDYIIMSAVAGDQHLADILVSGGTTEMVSAVLERGALVLSAAMLFERTLRDAQYRQQRELIDELLGPHTEITDALRERARRHGITEGTPLVARVVGVRGGQRQRALAVLRENASGRGIVALHASHICVIEPASPDVASFGDAGAYIVELLDRENIDTNVGSSSPVAGIARLPGAFAEARSVCNALVALGRRGEAADRAALGTAGMLMGAMDSPFARQLLTAQLGPLLEYDERRGTELVQTAWMYLDADSSHATAAKRLRIHPNTMRQRLERIDTILGSGWRRGGRRLDTHVALRLWRLQTQGVVTINT